MTERYLRAGEKILKERGFKVPYPMTWLEGQIMEDYIADVKIVQEYAKLNRQIILRLDFKRDEIKVRGRVFLCAQLSGGFGGSEDIAQRRDFCKGRGTGHYSDQYAGRCCARKREGKFGLEPVRTPWFRPPHAAERGETALYRVSL